MLIKSVKEMMTARFKKIFRRLEQWAEANNKLISIGDKCKFLHLGSKLSTLEVLVKADLF